MVPGHDGEAGNKEATMEELKKKVQELESTLLEHWEFNDKGDNHKTPSLRVPAKPTEAEWTEH